MNFYLLIIAALIVLETFSFYLIFIKAGYRGWYSLVPFYNHVVLHRIAKKPIWWTVLILIPYVNIFFLFVLFIEVSNAFNKRSVLNNLLACLFPFFYFPYLGLRKNVVYLYARNTRSTVRTSRNTWFMGPFFFFFFPMFYRSFFVEAFTVPGSSMENSVPFGSYVIVSKLSYGPRLPITPLAFPIGHNNFMGFKNYVESLQLPYFRFPGGKVERNDVIAFNFPEGDTVLASSNESYYAVCRELGRENVLNPEFTDPRPYSPNLGRGFGEIIYRPLDRKDIYLKRCVAVAGDLIEIKNKDLYVNNTLVENPPGIQFAYMIDASEGTEFELGQYFEENKIEEVYSNFRFAQLSEKQAEEISRIDGVRACSPIILARGIAEPMVFPHDTLEFKWNRDNLGPLRIPKKGVTVDLTTSNIPLYKRIIDVYENNDLIVLDDGIYINGQKVTSYTFEQDYFWAMGDSRHNSLDSRYWGFVPEDHIVGKMVWQTNLFGEFNIF